LTSFLASAGIWLALEPLLVLLLVMQLDPKLRIVLAECRGARSLPNNTDVTELLDDVSLDVRDAVLRSFLASLRAPPVSASAMLRLVPRESVIPSAPVFSDWKNPADDIGGGCLARSFLGDGGGEMTARSSCVGAGCAGTCCCR
jgi:hypothetical protein